MPGLHGHVVPKVFAVREHQVIVFGLLQTVGFVSLDRNQPQPIEVSQPLGEAQLDEQVGIPAYRQGVGKAEPPILAVDENYFVNVLEHVEGHPGKQGQHDLGRLTHRQDGQFADAQLLNGEHEHLRKGLRVSVEGLSGGQEYRLAVVD
jgi:hypothetical protein